MLCFFIQCVTVIRYTHLFIYLYSNFKGSQRDSSASATPKRSQSVEASNGGLKSRPAFTIKTEETKSSNSKGSRKSSTSSCESTAKAVTPTEKSLPGNYTVSFSSILTLAILDFKL